MNLKTLSKGALQVLRTLAPTIVDTAAGPFAPLIEPFVGKLLGTDQPTVGALDAFLTKLTPEQALAVRQADDSLQAKLAELKLQRDELPYQDTANARAMNIATKDATPKQLAWLIVAGFLGMVFFEAIAMIAFPAQWNALPRDAAALLGMAFGYLANEAKQVAAFYFGSSADSERKSSTLAELAKGAQQ